MIPGVDNDSSFLCFLDVGSQVTEMSRYIKSGTGPTTNKSSRISSCRIKKRPKSELNLKLLYNSHVTDRKDLEFNIVSLIIRYLVVETPLGSGLMTVVVR